MANPTNPSPRTAVRRESRIEVAAAELPLFCPRPNAALWSSHPRVFLAIEDGGEVRCPYCGTLYVLKRG